MSKDAKMLDALQTETTTSRSSAFSDAVSLANEFREDSRVGSGRLGRAVRDAAVSGMRVALGQLISRPTGLSWTLEGHVGDEHDAVDVLTHEAVERELYEALPEGVVVLGEEVHRAGFVLEGGYIAFVDPVDGTGPARDLLAGWACVILLYRLVAGHLIPVGAAIADGSGRVTWMDEDGHVFSEHLLLNDGVRIVDQPTPREGISALATVGAKPSARAGFRQLTSLFPDAVAYTLGGTPLVGPLLLGEISAVVALEEQTAWDSTHLLIAAQVGAAVVLLEDPRTVLDLAAVRDLFADPPLGKRIGTRVIPSFVVGPDEATVTAIAACICAEQSPNEEVML